MNPCKFGIVLIALALLLMAAGCDRAGQESATGSVSANEAYLKHFGEPPVPEQGSCFARVVYFPLADDPARVRAVPMFLFRENNQFPVLLDRLLDREWDFPSHSGLLNPFPPGSAIAVNSQADETVTIDLLLPAGAEMDSAAMIAPLVETVLQFKEVKRVFITRAGVSLAEIPEDGFRHDPSRIVPAGPPLLLMAAGSWEEGEEHPQEILINFDRPVDIGEFRLLDANGREIEGEYFRSIFDMAVVVHPSEPQTLHEGMTVRVSWEAVDRLGRTAGGEQSFILERFDH
ncbi:MAG: GerMN domain-containing protein [Desulfobulbaceae bacterium]|nr:GerMN domain-containing protein [Desulfobulbaceae bacterium]